MEEILKKQIVKYINKQDPKHEIVNIDEEAKKITYAPEIICHNPIKYENEGYVRAFLVVKLVTELGYSVKDIELEKHYNIGSQPEDKNAFIDIVVRERDNAENVFLFIECKAPEAYESNKIKIETQLFNMASIQKQEGKVSYLVYYSLEENRLLEKMFLIDLEETASYKKWIESKPLDDIYSIPANYGRIQHAYFANISEAKNNMKPLDVELHIEDFKKLQAKLHNVLWGGGSTSYNDIFFYLMHIFLAKIYDELWCVEEKEYEFQFRYEVEDSGKIVLEKQEATFARIEGIYKKAQKSLLNMPDEIISKSTFIDLDKVDISKIMSVVHMLEGISITKNKWHGDLLGDFFENIIETEFKQTKGQFFTPKNIVKFMIEALDVKEVALERIKSQDRADTLLPYIIDPSCGSGTFLLEAMKAISQCYVENKKEIKVANPIKNILRNQLFIEDENDENQINTWAKRFIYGIESNVELTTATKVNMILHGDGNANIFNKSGLLSFDVYHDPARIIQDFENKLEIQHKIRFCDQEYSMNEQFDFVITNPPFSLTFGDGEDAEDYKHRFLYSDKKNSENLFIERWYQLLKEGGRLAAVLPDSIFDTSENKYIRLFVLKYFRINAVISVDKIAFQPYTSTKVSILFATKRPKKQVELFEKLWSEGTKRYNELRKEKVIQYILKNEEIRSKLIKLADKYNIDISYEFSLLVNYPNLDSVLALLNEKCIHKSDIDHLNEIEGLLSELMLDQNVISYVKISQMKAALRSKEQKQQMITLKKSERVKKYVEIQKEYDVLKKKIAKNKDVKVLEEIKGYIEKNGKYVIENNDIAVLKQYLKDYYPDGKIEHDMLLERIYDDIIDVSELDYPNWNISTAKKYASGYCNSWWVLGNTISSFDEDIFMAEAENVGYKRTKVSYEIRENDLYSSDNNDNIIIDTNKPKTILDHIKKEKIWA